MEETSRKLGCIQMGVNRNSGIVAVCAGVALLLLLTFGVVFTRRQVTQREHNAEILRAEWRERNLQELLRLSAIGGLSSEEQARLEQAGNDPERMRQVMLALHEERLANASKDLEDAQQRKVELAGGGGYKVFADQAQPGDLVALANQDEWAATTAMAQDADGIRRIRAWQPVSYDSFVAAQTTRPATAGTAPVTAAASPPPLKPDPRMPLRSATTEASVEGPEKQDRVPLPNARAMADSALHPTVTVYSQAEPALSEVGDAAARRMAEAGIRDTLQRWAQAMTLNDPRAETAEYAPRMNRYFLRTNVGRDFVEADKMAYLRRGNRTASFDLRDVQIENETDTTADVRLVKDVTWGQSASGATHKLIRSQLWLARTEQGWKITGERDFR